MTRRISTRSNYGKPTDLPTIETDRLILRKMTPGDADAIFAYASDPEVTRYVVWGTLRFRNNLGVRMLSPHIQRRFSVPSLWAVTPSSKFS